jgi:hypothetical protein
MVLMLETVCFVITKLGTVFSDVFKYQYYRHVPTAVNLKMYFVINYK